MLEAFQKHLYETFPRITQAPVLVAVSGGVDSVVLAHLCRISNLDFAIAHCNFHLRDQESDRDENFVRDLARQYEVPVFVRDFDTTQYAAQKHISIQMAARDLRYAWFDQLVKEGNFLGVLIGHHADDNLETFLINFIRGTGLQGLCGIPPSNGPILRPLLPFSRKQIESYANYNELQWCEDSTNASDKYMRNRLRLDVIPVLKELNPQMLQGFHKTLDYLQQSNSIVEDYTGAIFSKVAVSHKYGYSFDIPQLKSIPNTKAILYELFRTFGFTQWEDIYDLLDAQPGKMVVSHSHRLIKDRDKLLLTELRKQKDLRVEIPRQEHIVMIPIGQLKFERVEGMQPSGKNEIFVDASKLSYPLVLRGWKEGDSFQPFGMKGTKKLSKYFKDLKLSLVEKENTLVLESDGKIVWILGHRADARFKVTKETTSILKISYEQ